MWEKNWKVTLSSSWSSSLQKAKDQVSKMRSLVHPCGKDCFHYLLIPRPSIQPSDVKCSGSFIHRNNFILPFLPFLYFLNFFLFFPAWKRGNFWLSSIFHKQCTEYTSSTIAIPAIAILIEWSSWSCQTLVNKRHLWDGKLKREIRQLLKSREKREKLLWVLPGIRFVSKFTE